MNEFIGNTPQIPKGIEMPVFPVGSHSRRELVWVAVEFIRRQLLQSQIPKGIKMPKVSVSFFGCFIPVGNWVGLPSNSFGGT